MVLSDDSSDAELVSSDVSAGYEDDFESAKSDISIDASDAENAIIIDDEEDPIQDDFEDILPLFPAVPKPQPSVALLKPEDAELSVVQLSLKYAFGLHSFRGHQEVRSPWHMGRALAYPRSPIVWDHLYTPGNRRTFAHCRLFNVQCSWHLLHMQAIVHAALQGKDLLVLMPTGGGKSLCFQLPAVMARGVTVVITPLISLMYDQVQALLHAPNGGIPVTYISSQRTLQV